MKDQTSLSTHQDKGFSKKEILEEAAKQAKQAGTNLSKQAAKKAEEVKLEARKQIDHQKEEVVSQIQGVNQALRQTADNLNNPALGDRIEKLAHQVERAADRLEGAELEDVLVAAEDFSRNQPLIFLGSSFMAGVMLARFLRASKHESSGTLTDGSKAQVPMEKSLVAAGSENRSDTLASR